MFIFIVSISPQLPIWEDQTLSERALCLNKLYLFNLFVYLRFASMGTFVCFKFIDQYVATQPIRKALRTPKFVLSEVIYLRTKKSSEAPDKFGCVVRTSDKNDSFLRTPALLTLKFCGVIQH